MKKTQCSQIIRGGKPYQMLLSMEESILPEGYAQVEWLDNNVQQNSAAYVNTGITGLDGRTSRIEIDACWKFKSVTGLSNWNILFAAQASDNDSGTIQVRVYNTTGTASSASLISNLNESDRISVTAGVPFHVVLDKTTFQIGSQTVTTKCGTTAALGPLCIGKPQWDRGTEFRYWEGLLGRCTVYSNNVLVGDLVPAKRLSDGIYGYYDIVRSTFIASSNSVPFKEGVDQSSGSLSSGKKAALLQFYSAGEKSTDYFYDARWDNGQTWYVDSNVSSSGDGKSRSAAFRTLKEATDAASDWDTIHICECTLSMSSGITTSKSLKIEGEGRDKTVVKGTGTSSSVGYFIRFDATIPGSRLEVRSMTIRDFSCSSYFVTDNVGPALCCNKSSSDTGQMKTRAELEAAYSCFMLDCSVLSCKCFGSNNYYQGGSIAHVLAICSVFDHSSSAFNSGVMKNCTCVNCIIRECSAAHNTVGDRALYGCTVYNCSRGSSNYRLIDYSSLTLRNTLFHNNASYAQSKLNVNGLANCAFYGSFQYEKASPDSTCVILSTPQIADTSTLRLDPGSAARGKADPEFIWLERDVWGNQFSKSNAAIGAVQS